MMFEIDFEKAKSKFMKYFPENPLKGSFNRSGILTAMIRQNFEMHETFIINWYWKIQDKNFDNHPHEREVILETLHDMNEKTRKALMKIKNDKRFKVYEKT